MYMFCHPHIGSNLSDNSHATTRNLKPWSTTCSTQIHPSSTPRCTPCRTPTLAPYARTWLIKLLCTWTWPHIACRKHHESHCHAEDVYNLTSRDGVTGHHAWHEAYAPGDALQVDHKHALHWICAKRDYKQWHQHTFYLTSYPSKCVHMILKCWLLATFIQDTSLKKRAHLGCRALGKEGDTQVIRQAIQMAGMELNT